MEARQSTPIAFLAAAEGTEQVELVEPWQAVLAMGWRPLLVSPEPGRIQSWGTWVARIALAIGAPSTSTS